LGLGGVRDGSLGRDAASVRAAPAGGDRSRSRSAAIAPRRVVPRISGSFRSAGAPPASRIEADAEGLRPRRPLARTLPWSDVAGAEPREGQVRVFSARERAAGTNPKLSIDMSGWNAVILPRVVAQLATR
jgi:hypothetical protein